MKRPAEQLRLHWNEEEQHLKRNGWTAGKHQY
jgi:hypothetical protein